MRYTFYQFQLFILLVMCATFTISTHTWAQKATSRLQLEFQSIKVTAKKPNGKKWDLTGKPDLLIQIWVNQSLLDTFKVYKDVTETTFHNLSSTPFDYQLNKTEVEIKVFDADLGSHDHMAHLKPKLTVSVNKPTQQLTLKGEAVLELSLKAHLSTEYVAEENKKQMTMMSLQLKSLNAQIEFNRKQAKMIKEQSVALQQKASAAEAELVVLRIKEKVAQAKLKGVKNEVEKAQSALLKAQKVSQEAEKKAQASDQKAQQAQQEATQQAQRAQKAEKAAQQAQQKAKKAQMTLKDKDGDLAKTQKELVAMRKKAQEAKQAHDKLAKEAKKRIEVAKKAAEEANKALSQIENLK